MSYFADIAPLTYEGPDSGSDLCYRHYNPDEMVMGKRMEDHLRFAVAWWHSFAWEGGDPFGGPTFLRPWQAGSDLDHAMAKADAAFSTCSIAFALSSASSIWTLDDCFLRALSYFFRALANCSAFVGSSSGRHSSSAINAAAAPTLSFF